MPPPAVKRVAISAAAVRRSVAQVFRVEVRSAALSAALANAEFVKSARSAPVSRSPPSMNGYRKLVGSSRCCRLVTGTLAQLGDRHAGMDEDEIVAAQGSGECGNGTFGALRGAHQGRSIRCDRQNFGEAAFVAACDA